MQSRPLLAPPAMAGAAAIMVVACCLAACPSLASAGGGFYKDFEVVWGDDPHPERRVNVVDGGRVVSLTLNNVSGSGFQSRDAFLFGEFTMAMKLVPGDSAGTVTTFYGVLLLNFTHANWHFLWMYIRAADVQGPDGGGRRPRSTRSTWSSWATSAGSRTFFSIKDALLLFGKGGAVPDADQRVRAGGGQQGAALIPLVRPHAGLPQLHNPLEPSQHHLLGGRHAGASLQQPRVAGPSLPEPAGDEGARHHLGRQRLGHARRPGQDRLVPRALRRLLPDLRHRPRLRLLLAGHQRRRRAHLLLPEQRCVGRRRRVDGTAAGAGRRARDGVGEGELHGDGLLRGSLEHGPPSRVRHRPARLRRPC